MVGSEGAEESAPEEELFSKPVRERQSQHEPQRTCIGLGEDVVKSGRDEWQMLANQVGDKEAQEGDDAECEGGE